MPASFPSLQPHFCLQALILQLDFCQLVVLLQIASASHLKSCHLYQHQNCQLFLVFLQNLWFACILCHGVLHDNSTNNHKTIIFLCLEMEQLSLTSLTHSPFSNLSPVPVLVVFSILFCLPAQFPLISNNKSFIN